MIKQFTTLQLFSIVDGRLSTYVQDVYNMLNHICNDNLMTHHLPVALDYLKKKNPKWFQEQKMCLEELNMITDNSNDFTRLIDLINIEGNNHVIDVPQLRDEFDTSDFEEFMIDNSLLLSKA